MARKRMIDPEFWSDEEISAISFPARLFYIGLWNFADDEGRGKGHSKLLKAHIFPYDDDINVDKLKKEVSIKVEWYEVNNQQYYNLPNFLKHQRIDRPTPSKLPLNEGSTSPLRDVVPNIIEVKLSKEQNIDLDTPIKAVLKSVPPNFDPIWELYPKKLGKKDAQRHFYASLKSGRTVAEITKSIKNYIQFIKDNKTEPQYVLHGSTFFNNWEDYLNYESNSKPRSRTDSQPTIRSVKDFNPAS